ncbi:uncharacterized protein LOC130298045 [Hyla sarda]|uniref:uncharacterized protein LOC130298045 n=1 Tax=Hyla sarda TaxID=327740 RepID=UPI0024C43A8C|nr:uncharacterized protein LOC130298045 [Hyla sarda]
MMSTLLHRKLRVWWNKSLESYISRNLIPRGLRIQVFPSLPINVDTFTTRWAEVCTHASLQFMELLVGLHKRTLEEVEMEISNVQTRLDGTASPEETETFKTKMEKQHSVWEKDISERKSKKLSRDIHDFQQKTIYRWQRKANNDLPQQRRRAMSVSSISSSREYSGPTYRPIFFNNRQKRKKDFQRDNGKRKYGSRESSTSRDDNAKVINLSQHELSESDVSVLSKGLTFSPTAPFDHFTALKDLHIFARSLIFKKWYHKKENITTFTTPAERQAIRDLEDLLTEQETSRENQVLTCIKPRSKNFPSLSVCPIIDTFVNIVDEEFKKIKRNTYNDNLTREERQSLERLRKLNDVIIKRADKGGNIIVWPREMYEAEARRQLRDNTCYKKLSFNPLISFKNSLEIILERAEADSTISSELHRALSVLHPKIPTLYLLPKVHKHPTRPPGRPIISDVTLTRDQEVFIQTNVYRKPTATNTYLHATSAHPKHMKDAVPVGQYLRIRRICSTDTMFEEQARFKERGYSQRCLKKAYRRARETPRQLLQKKPPRISDDTIRYISDYNAHWEEMRRAIEKHLPILKTDSVLHHYVPDRLQMTARRARNLISS